MWACRTSHDGQNDSYTPKEFPSSLSKPLNMIPHMAKRTLQMWLKSRTWDEEIILDYPVGPNLTLWVFFFPQIFVFNCLDSFLINLKAENLPCSRELERQFEKHLAQHCWLWIWRKRMQAKECRRPPESGKGKEADSPQSLQKEQRPANTFYPSEILVRLWPPEL